MASALALTISINFMITPPICAPGIALYDLADMGEHRQRGACFNSGELAGFAGLRRAERALKSDHVTGRYAHASPVEVTPNGSAQVPHSTAEGASGLQP
ncbi:hypothetical protein SBA_ch2_7850 [Sphingomonas bisphenolicum]|uniref:Uncharacterized protein n=1 Tax=Sphingomonas bisphenolicum TaxID=296544 RepID=A0ABM7G836_9SPHN|nr:hypothetical protein SBA_ch2_7850 [Sphingomonas bisphenolicum]